MMTFPGCLQNMEKQLIKGKAKDVLNPKFVESLDTLKASLFGQGNSGRSRPSLVRPKMIGNDMLDGRMLVQLLNTFVDQLNTEESMPQLTTVWGAVADKANSEAKHAALRTYNALMAKAAEAGSQTKDALDTAHDNALAAATREMHRIGMGEDLAAAVAEVTEVCRGSELERFDTHNRTLCDSGNLQLLSSLWAASGLEEAGSGLQQAVSVKKLQQQRFSSAADVLKANTTLAKK
jgi:hypothetical protein